MTRITIQYRKDSYDKMDKHIKTENILGIISLATCVVYKGCEIKKGYSNNSSITATISINRQTNIDYLDRMIKVIK